MLLEPSKMDRGTEWSEWSFEGWVTYKIIKNIQFNRMNSSRKSCAIFFFIMQEVQMAMTALSVTYLRSLAVDFTIPFSEEPVSLLIPYPQLEGTITRIIKPFKSEVDYTCYANC